MEIILNKPGITRAEFHAQSGRSRDLNWDIKKGRVVMDENHRIWPAMGLKK